MLVVVEVTRNLGVTLNSNPASILQLSIELRGGGEGGVLTCLRSLLLIAAARFDGGDPSFVEARWQAGARRLDKLGLKRVFTTRPIETENTIGNGRGRRRQGGEGGDPPHR